MIKKRLFKLMPWVFAFALVLSSVAYADVSPEYAKNFYWDGKLGTGLTNISYYIDNSFSSSLKNSIKASLTEWSQKSNYKITFAEATLESSAIFIFKKSTGLASYVEFYTYTQVYPYIQKIGDDKSPPSGNWRKCYIYLLPDATQRTIKHEIGHCFGLKHPPFGQTPSIMFESNVQHSGKSDTVTTWDIDLINCKYQ